MSVNGNGEVVSVNAMGRLIKETVRKPSPPVIESVLNALLHLLILRTFKHVMNNDDHLSKVASWRSMKNCNS